jgi:hypothetical protein
MRYLLKLGVELYSIAFLTFCSWDPLGEIPGFFFLTFAWHH